MAFFGLGSNGEGQLCVGDTEDRYEPTEIPLPPLLSHSTPLDLHFSSNGNTTLLVDGSSHSLLFGGKALRGLPGAASSTLLPSKTAVLAACCGWTFALAQRKDDFSLVGYGSWSGLNWSTCGLGRAFHRMVSMSAGQRHCCLVAEDGDLFTVGDNRHGELGMAPPREVPIGEFAPARVPFFSRARATGAVSCACGWWSTTVLTESGHIFLFGRSKFTGLDSPAPVQVLVPSPSRVIKIASGWHHSLALLADGCLVLWGRGDYGQLGTGGRSHHSYKNPVVLQREPGFLDVAAGSEHVVAIDQDSQVLAWGWAEHGQVGRSLDGENVLTPQVLKGIKGQRVFAGAGVTIILEKT
jgi:hypothetical protein